MRCILSLLYPYLVRSRCSYLFLFVLFHTPFNSTALSPFYHLTPRFLCFGSSFLGTEPPFPDMSNMQLYSVG